MATNVAPLGRIPEWTLGERMAKARKEAGMTQDDIAEKLGCSSGAVAQWERELSQPRKFMATMRKWATVTGVSEAWLLGLPFGGGGGQDRLTTYKGKTATISSSSEAQTPSKRQTSGGLRHAA